VVLALLGMDVMPASARATVMHSPVDASLDGS
jgi:hypothetical protein